MRVRLFIKRSADDINPAALDFYTEHPHPEAIAEEIYKAFTAQTGLHFDATGIRQIVAGLQRLIASDWARLIVGEGQPMEYLLPAPPLRDPPPPPPPFRPVLPGPPAPPARVPQADAKPPPPVRPGPPAPLAHVAHSDVKPPPPNAQPPAALKPPPSTPQPAPDAKPSPQGKAMKPLNRD